MSGVVLCWSCVCDVTAHLHTSLTVMESSCVAYYTAVDAIIHLVHCVCVCVGEIHVIIWLNLLAFIIETRHFIEFPLYNIFYGTQTAPVQLTLHCVCDATSTINVCHYVHADYKSLV